MTIPWAAEAVLPLNAPAPPPPTSTLNGIFFSTSELPLLDELTNITTTEGSQLPRASQHLVGNHQLVGAAVTAQK